MKRLLPILISLLLLSGQTLRASQEKDSLDRTFYIPPVEYKMNWKNLVIPAALITTGAVFSSTDHKDIFNINRSDRYPASTPFEDYFQLCIGGSVFLFDLVAEEKHHPLDQLFLLGGSYICGVGSALAVKHLFPSDRPMGDERTSFPSGHTTVAFVGAHVLWKEFKDTNPWIAYGGYVMASTVGLARIHNNRHWVCDVLAGAGLGILGTELAYAVYFPIRNYVTDKLNKKYGVQTNMAPLASPGNYGLSFSIRF